MDGRVNGSLNLSRAIGDMEYKQTSHLSAAEQAVTAFPDVRQIQLGSSSEFMILACDGIWDVLNNQQVWALVIVCIHACTWMLVVYVPLCYKMVLCVVRP